MLFEHMIRHFKSLLAMLGIVAGALLISSFAMGAEKSPVKCGECAEIALDVSRYSSQAASLRKRLNEQRAQLSSLVDDQELQSKKKAAALTVFVLSAKLETAENWREINQSKWNASCRACPK